MLGGGGGGLCGVGVYCASNHITLYSPLQDGQFDLVYELEPHSRRPKQPTVSINGAASDDKAQARDQGELSHGKQA